jgi:tetratricopeptide (TPR) repeat protein
MGNLNGLGLAYQNLGDSHKSIIYFELGIPVAQDAKNRQAEGAFLGNLGITYAALGNAHKAIEYHEQSLVIAREIGNRRDEEKSLGSLGSAYKYLGDTRKAIEYHEQALVIDREIGDKQGEGADLCNLGNRYVEIGDAHKAIEYYKQALVISREIGDYSGESIDLENTGYAWLSLDNNQKAKENYQQAILIADEISFPIVQQSARRGLAQTYLFQNNLVNAHATVEAALQYDVPESNHDASALHGIIALRQGDEVTARGAFVRAIGQADEILSKTAEFYSALDAKGLALCGLILAGRGDPSMPTETTDESGRVALTNAAGRGDPSGQIETNDGKTVPPDQSTVSAGRVAPTVDDAIQTFRKARKIAPHAGIVKSVLRLFDELAKCDQAGVLKGVRDVIDTKPLVE